MVTFIMLEIAKKKCFTKMSEEEKRKSPKKYTENKKSNAIVRALCIKIFNFFKCPPPTSFVKNFLLIHVVVSVWLQDENLCSYRAKRVVYYQKKMHESSLLSADTLAVPVQRETAKTRKLRMVRKKWVLEIFSDEFSGISRLGGLSLYCDYKSVGVQK